MNKTFPLEKILEVDLKTYLESVDKKVSDYILIGVRKDGRMPGFINNEFAEIVPSKAEVVIGYHVTLYSVDETEKGAANAYGTALIPKR